MFFAGENMHKTLWFAYYEYGHFRELLSNHTRASQGRPMGASNTRIKMLPARDLEAADMVNWPLALLKDENNANFLAHKRYATA